MKVVMLGHSAAGKTTYVSLMYSVMTQGVGGFSLRTKRTEDHDTLIRAAEAILTGRYPAPTDQRSVFQLKLRHNNADVFPFSWRDYRGGALGERSDSPQARQLHDDLGKAGGIVLFCDSHRLLTESRAAREVRTLVSHVQRAVDAKRKRLTPLVITLTKADLVDLDDEKVTDRLQEPFLPLIAAVSHSEHVIGTLVPVACGPEPVNVAVPVLWALRFGILGRARKLQESIEQSIARAEQAERGDTLGDRISSWWNGTTPQWKRAQQHRAEAAAEYAKVEPLVDPANRLGEVLDGLPGF